MSTCAEAQRNRVHCSYRNFPRSAAPASARASVRLGASSTCSGRCAAFIGALLLLVGAVPPVAAGAEQYREDTVKAAFLYRFTGYVDWPEGNVPEREFTIAVLGSDAVLRELQRVVARQQILRRPVRVLQVQVAAQAAKAQVLYVGPEYVGSLQAAVDALASRPVLVVSDQAEGLDSGSTINFLLLDRRVRFEVSLTAAQRAGLRISSELLSVAARVRGAPTRTGLGCGPEQWGLFEDDFCYERVAHSAAIVGTALERRPLAWLLPHTAKSSDPASFVSSRSMT